MIGALHEISRCGRQVWETLQKSLQSGRTGADDRVCIARYESLLGAARPVPEKIEVQESGDSLQRKLGHRLPGDRRSRIDVDDDHDSTRVTMIASHIDNATHTYAQESNGR